jgi:SSS family solute:Na+ symporter
MASLLAALITSLIGVLNSVSTLVVRDFIVEFRPATEEKKQVSLGRVVIVAVTLLGIGAAYMVYKNEEGLYKYLQTISAYLVVPVFPAILFGILSRKVTLKGAYASVFVGIILATIFVIDQLAGEEAGSRLFPFLHHKLTLNFGYRGLWAELIITIVLFAVSAFTEKTDPSKLVKTTVDYSKGLAAFKGISDWRLHLSLLTVVTILILIWLR